MMEADPGREKLLRMLVCPACHEPVRQKDDTLVCDRCGRVFPIKGGIPIMLVQRPAPEPDNGTQGPPEQ